MKGIRVFQVLASAALMVPAVVAQQFEVASVKPCKDAPQGGGITGRGNSTPGRFNVNCRSVLSVIQEAYLRYAGGRANPSWVLNVPVEGVPPWIRTEKFDFDAKAERGASIELMSGPMMQALLEDRFKLKVHRETREVPVYELTVAKGGAKLPKFQEGSCVTVDFAKTPLTPDSKYCRTIGTFKGAEMTIAAQGMTLEEFSNLFLKMDRPVIDKTGMEGRFDFQLQYAPDESTPEFFRHTPQGMAGSDPLGRAASDPLGPSIFDAVQRQLGLRLVRARGPAQFLVIDHVERPSEN
jgi:uncharacterized protein (TIGR03435 family)